ncbi:MAG: hypothetical protein HQM04_06555 [Magnetococcales bacterium]|nr:hypothetical protein [Magnetococcales bacterium]MBF0114688.1 hypothetical protein [Magnetococcales bacterium]
MNKTLTVNGVAIEVVELTVDDIAAWLQSSAEPPEQVDLAGDMLFADVRLSDLVHMTRGLTRAELGKMTPSQIRDIVERCKAANADFFAHIAAPMLEVRSRRFQQAMSRAGNDWSDSSERPAPLSAPDMPVSGAILGAAS